MGRQLAPDEPMFAGAVQDAGVDLSLEGGDNLVDLDLLSTPEGDEGLDLDLGKVAAASADAEVDRREHGDRVRPGRRLDVVHHDPGNRRTRGWQHGRDADARVAVVRDADRRDAALKASQAARDRMQPATPDSTAEMAIDDLGLDLGNLDNLPDIDDATAIATGMHDEMTQIAQRYAIATEVPARAHGGRRRHGPDAARPRGDGRAPKSTSARSTSTSESPPTRPDNSPTARDTLKTEQMPQLSNLEPVTMSEVGTKLDLARAYMDMGDPDGARNILQEVLAEGSASQKQEARRLIDSLPGA